MKSSRHFIIWLLLAAFVACGFHPVEALAKSPVREEQPVHKKVQRPSAKKDDARGALPHPLPDPNNPGALPHPLPDPAKVHQTAPDT